MLVCVCDWESDPFSPQKKSTTGKLYSIGGRGPSNVYHQDIEVTDDLDKAWTPYTLLSETYAKLKGEVGAAVWEIQSEPVICIVGGRRPNDLTSPPAASDAAWCFDENGRAKQLPAMNIARVHPAVAVRDGEQLLQVALLAVRSLTHACAFCCVCRQAVCFRWLFREHVPRQLRVPRHPRVCSLVSCVVSNGPLNCVFLFLQVCVGTSGPQGLPSNYRHAWQPNHHNVLPDG